MTSSKLKMLCIIVGCIAAMQAFSQSTVPTVLNFDSDSVNIAYLINHGVKIADKRTIAWFPKDSLSDEKMREIVEMINRGISGAEKFIRAPLPWQVHKPGNPFTFYFRYDKFVSHASHEGFVSIPFWRIKDGKAPWLHEVVHEMLNTKNGDWYQNITREDRATNLPLWLSEGLAEYISIQVSLQYDLARFDVMNNSYETNADSLFRNDLKSEKGSYILSFIGKKGVMPELSSKDRRLYAPAFYHGSCSFIHYIAKHYGLDTLLAGISSFRKEHETIEKFTGKEIQTLKNLWLADIGLGGLKID